MNATKTVETLTTVQPSVRFQVFFLFLKIKRHLLLFALCNAGFPSFSQQYNFRNYSVSEGLPQSQVYALCEDKRGFLWIGTRGGGAARFDGNTFVNFTEENGLPGNFIRCIYEDKKGNIWFGTDEGLSRYDGRNFSTVTLSPELTSGMINALTEDDKGNLWIGTEEHGALVYDGNNITVRSKTEGLADNKVHCFYTDKTNKLWIGTETGASCFNGSGFTNYTTRDGLAANIIYGITEDLNGNLWFSTYGGGVNSFDGKKFTTYTVKQGLCNNTVNCILNDKKGNIWFGTAIGASQYNCADKTFTTFTDKEGLCGNVVMSLLKDSSGNIWFGSSGGGISRFDSKRFIHFNDRNGKIGAWVYAVMQDREGNMWFGSSNGGAVKYDGFIYSHFTRKQGLTDAKVKCMYEDANGTLWFGTGGEGLYYYNGKTFSHLSKKDGLCGNFVNAITEDRLGNLWIATSGGGICCYYPGKKKFIRYGLTGSLGSERVSGLCVDKNGQVWAATQYAGISKILVDPVTSTGKIISYNTGTGLGKTTVRSVLELNGKIFLGTAGKGVVILDGEKHGVITKKDGIYSNNIYSLLRDNSGNLWVGTEKGIDKVELTSASTVKSVKHYGKPEGFSGSETAQNAVCLDDKGRLWFGTISGVTCYTPSEDNPNTTLPRTHLTGIRLSFDKIEETEYADTLAKWFPVPQQLTLPYYKNNLSFDFTGINLRDPENVRYKWKLEGYDKEWSPETELHTATYSNLPHGDFIFKVKACNEDGIWNEQERAFAFSILSPYWETWWFRAGIVIAAILLITRAFSWRVNYIRRQNEAERDKLELEKNIAELEQKALRLQMNPHFIFNALNSIQGFISTNETAEAKRHLAKFSRLMRQILESSKQPFIPLHEETSILSNYLDLEKLSSGSNFDYTISVDPAIPGTAAIPAMIIQPFVENAVLHGLRGKKGGTINIEFRMAQPNLICEITDNGIGIKRAAEKKKEAGITHTSTGIEVTEQRLRLLSANQEGSPVTFTDLSDAGTGLTGTKVSIRLPFIEA